MEDYLKEKPELDRKMALGGKQADQAVEKAHARLDRIQALLMAVMQGMAEGQEVQG